MLDGNLNPAQKYMFYQGNLGQDAAMYPRRDSWFDWIAQYHDKFGLGTTRAEVRAAWDGILTELRRQPRVGVGPNEYIGATFGTLYSERNWAALAQAISDYVVRGDDTALLEYASVVTDAAGENSTAAYNAVSCLDSYWPEDRATYEADAARMHTKFPFAAWYNTWNNAACESWPVPHQDRVVPDGRGLPPILMLSNLGDPATPHAGAVALHRLLPSSRLVSVQSGMYCEFAQPQGRHQPGGEQDRHQVPDDGCAARRRHHGSRTRPACTNRNPRSSGLPTASQLSRLERWPW